MTLKSFTGCRPFQVHCVEHLCSILPDFNWQLACMFPQRQLGFVSHCILWNAFNVTILSITLNHLYDHKNLPLFSEVHSAFTNIADGHIYQYHDVANVVAFRQCCSYLLRGSTIVYFGRVLGHGTNVVPKFQLVAVADSNSWFLLLIAMCNSNIFLYNVSRNPDKGFSSWLLGCFMV